MILRATTTKEKDRRSDSPRAHYKDERVLELLKQETCVLSTSSLSGAPEAATVTFAVDEGFCFYFESFPSYRKVKNLLENPKAALVIDSGYLSLQVEGKIEFIEGKRAVEAENLLVLKVPGMKEFLKAHEHVIFKLTPNWARLTDAGKMQVEQVI